MNDIHYPQGPNGPAMLKPAPHDEHPALIEVLKLAEENKRLRRTVAALEGIIDGLKGERDRAMRAAVDIVSSQAPPPIVMCKDCPHGLAIDPVTQKLLP